MKVLVAVASKHGATAAIGEAIAGWLQQDLAAGGPEAPSTIDVQVREPGEVTSVAGYDAVILGSAVYAGKWRKPARHFVTRHAAALRAVPVWLFSSGPVGDPLAPDTEPADGAEMRELTGAMEHRVFAGELDRATLNMAERAIVSALGVAEGDFRDWEQVREWVGTIAAALLGGRAEPRHPDTPRTRQ